MNALRIAKLEFTVKNFRCLSSLSMVDWLVVSLSKGP